MCLFGGLRIILRKYDGTWETGRAARSPNMQKYLVCTYSRNRRNQCARESKVQLHWSAEEGLWLGLYSLSDTAIKSTSPVFSPSAFSGRKIWQGQQTKSKHVRVCVRALFSPCSEYVVKNCFMIIACYLPCSVVVERSVCDGRRRKSLRRRFQLSKVC